MDLASHISPASRPVWLQTWQVTNASSCGISKVPISSGVRSSTREDMTFFHMTTAGFVFTTGRTSSGLSKPHQTVAV